VLVLKKNKKMKVNINEGFNISNSIEINELKKYFTGKYRSNDVKAVDGICFEVKKGELFGFLGPNGAGKTTTIKMLCG